jgi:hypothetical protein
MPAPGTNRLLGLPYSSALMGKVKRYDLEQFSNERINAARNDVNEFAAAIKF